MVFSLNEIGGIKYINLMWMSDRRYLIEKFNWCRATTLRTAQSLAISLAISPLLASTSPVFAKPLPALQLFQNVTLSPNFSPDPQIFKGIGGGSLPMKSISGTDATPTGGCMGFIDKAPDRQFVLESFFNYLKIEVNSLEDTTLLIEGPGGVWCNDDYQGKNPGVAGQWLEGTYRIWVGSYKQGEYHPYTIVFTQKP